MPLAIGGFGGEVREAMQARTEHLIQEGLARKQGDHVTFERNLLAILRRRELDEVAAKLSVTTGLPRMEAVPGEHVIGIYRRRLTLSSGRFAMVDDGLGFQLCPGRRVWRRSGGSMCQAWSTMTVGSNGASGGNAARAFNASYSLHSRNS